MSSYTGTANRPDRAKAIAAVIAVHAALAAIILAGLNVRMVTAAIEQMKTFDVREPPPPPQRPPLQQPAPRPERARQAAGEPAKKAEAAPIVAPTPRLPVPSPVPATKVAGMGSAPSSGAGTSGTGTGAGGSGSGPGGGGYGDYSRFTPARIVRRIPNSEYRRISGGRMPFGSATIAFRVNPDGTMANCRIVRSSGDPYVDSIVCDAARRNMRFSPARDPSGRPVAQDMAYTPTWSRNRY
jgi:periplasmic protein TonB